MHERRKCPHVIGEFFALVPQRLNFGLGGRIGNGQAGDLTPLFYRLGVRD